MPCRDRGWAVTPSRLCLCRENCSYSKRNLAYRNKACLDHSYRISFHGDSYCTCRVELLSVSLKQFPEMREAFMAT